MQSEGPQKKSGRVDAVDCARAAALLGMVLYHLSWDLADFRLVPPMLPYSPPMRLFSNTVASAFLLLVGVSLALAHRDQRNLSAFLRRFAIVAGAAALVTAASFAFAPGQVIWFGILQCIAVASVLALPLVKAHPSASLAAGAAAIALPVVVQSRLFDPPALLWLGLGKALPNTVDWRPLLPWAGVVLIGLGLARLPGVIRRITSPSRWRARSGPTRTLCLAGRNSLLIYLIHQPILNGLVAAVAASGLVATLPPLEPDFSAFLTSCQRTCADRGRTVKECASSCRCVADAIERSGQAGQLGQIDREREADLKRMASACMGR